MTAKPSPKRIRKLAAIADSIRVALNQHDARPNDAVVAMASMIGLICANKAKSWSELDTFITAVRKVVEHSATTIYQAKGGTIQ